MDDKVLVRLGHGYYNGGITPLPNVCPTIDAHIGCWHILIGEKMEDIKYIVVDGFNQSIRADQTCFGTITRNAGADLKRNGQGVIEIVDEPLALDEQNGYIRQDGTVGTLTTDGSSPKHNNRIVELNGKHPYELSDAMKKYIVSKDDKYRVSNGNLIVNRDIACAKTTREGCTRADASDYISPDLMPNENTLNYRIRKLTPKECGRLMGVRDDDIDKMSVNQSNSSLYHCFGDALVTTVIGAIFCVKCKLKINIDNLYKVNNHKMTRRKCRKYKRKKENKK